MAASGGILPLSWAGLVPCCGRRGPALAWCMGEAAINAVCAPRIASAGTGPLPLRRASGRDGGEAWARGSLLPGALMFLDGIWAAGIFRPSDTWVLNAACVAPSAVVCACSLMAGPRGLAPPAGACAWGMAKPGSRALMCRISSCTVEGCGSRGFSCCTPSLMSPMFSGISSAQRALSADGGVDADSGAGMLAEWPGRCSAMYSASMLICPHCSASASAKWLPNSSGALSVEGVVRDGVSSPGMEIIFIGALVSVVIGRGGCAGWTITLHLHAVQPCSGARRGPGLRAQQGLPKP